MKKFLSLCALLLLASPAFAVTITGKVVDGLTNKNLSDVVISIGEGDNAITVETDKDGFIIDNFTPNSEKPATISFELAEYEKLAGEFEIEEQNKLFYSGGNVIHKEVGKLEYKRVFDHMEELEGKPHPVYKNVLEVTPDTIDLGKIELYKTPETIISGEITIEEGDRLAIFKKNVKITVSNDYSNGITFILQKCEGKVKCKYKIDGYLGDNKNPRNYSLTFHYGGAEDKVYKDIEENDIKVTN